jgi:hypothetical protein
MQVKGDKAVSLVWSFHEVSAMSAVKDRLRSSAVKKRHIRATRLIDASARHLPFTGSRRRGA